MGLPEQIAEDWFTQKCRDPEFVKGFLEEQQKMHADDLRDAVAAENEGCAQLIECTPVIRGRVVQQPREIAAFIRARRDA